MHTVDKSLRKGVIAGLVGGLIGTIVMTQFQNAWSAASKALENENSKKRRSDSMEEDATMKAAGKIAELAGRRLSHEQKKKFGPVVHYAFGTLQGGAYGGMTELTGTDGGLTPGLIFGSALFTVADEILRRRSAFQASRRRRRFRLICTGWRRTLCMGSARNWRGAGCARRSDRRNDSRVNPPLTVEGGTCEVAQMECSRKRHRERQALRASTFCRG